MSVKVMTQVFEEADCSGNDRIVLLVLADHAADDGSGAYPSQGTIARKARITDRTVRDCLRRLTATGYIKAVKKRSTGVVEYRVLPPAESAAADLSDRQPAADKPSISSESSPEGELTRDGSPADSRTPADSRQQMTISVGQDPLGRVWQHYLNRMGKKLREPQSDEREILRKALKAADHERDLLACIDACADSDYHMKRGRHRSRKGGKYNSLPQIFKPRPGKAETWVSRIEWWLERRGEQLESGPTREGRYTRG